MIPCAASQSASFQQETVTGELIAKNSLLNSLPQGIGSVEASRYCLL
jgi:hypothetical protein